MRLIYLGEIWVKLTSDESFLSKHQIYRLKIFVSVKKEGQKSWGHLENLGLVLGWGAETLSDLFKKQTPCKMAVIGTNQ